MKIREIMTTDVRSVRLEDTLDKVARVMAEENVGAVPVLDEGRELRGIITDRDIVVRCIAAGKEASDTEAEEVLTDDPTTISADIDVEEAARIMARKQVRRLPVVDDEGELVGMVSLGDLAVKSEDEDLSAEALEDISQGVKQGGAARTQPRRAVSARDDAAMAERHRGGTRAANAYESKMQDNEDFDLEFSDEKDAQTAAGSRRTRPQSMNAQQPRGANKAAIPAQGARAVGKPKSEGNLRQAKPGKQGITNQVADEENKRNARVVSIREEAKAAPKKRGSRKTG